MPLKLGVEDLGEEGGIRGGDGEGWWCGGWDEGVEVWEVGFEHGGGAGEEGQCFGVRGEDGMRASDCETPRFC